MPRTERLMNSQFSQPGDVVQLENAMILPAGHVILLWSPYGVEGIYTNPRDMALQIHSLNQLAAYISAVFTYEIRPLNGVHGKEEG